MISNVSSYNNVNSVSRSYQQSSVNKTQEFALDSRKDLQDNAILSSLHLETGESIGIYYDETSPADKKLLVAKIIGPDGSTREVKIDPEEVDPENASYVEMLALSAHLKQQGKIDGPAGALATMVFEKRVKEANAKNNVYDRQDFVSGMNEFVNNALKDGQMDTYLRYLKELTIYLGLKTNSKY